MGFRTPEYFAHPDPLAQEREASVEAKEGAKEKIARLQLEYVQKLIENKDNKDFSPSESVDVSTMSFFEIVDTFTDLSKKVGDAYGQSKGEPFWNGENYPKFNEVYRQVVARLEQESKSDPQGWVEKADAVILELLPAPESPVELPEGRKPQEFRAGVLRYSVDSGFGGLEDIKITPDDVCVKTHLDSISKQEDVPEGKSLSELYEDAYRQLAVQLAKKYTDPVTEVKAIISESWLFNTNLPKKIPVIHTYSSNSENFFRGTAFWGQFLNKEGGINEERAKQLLETGQPPFKVKSMYIPMNEFMERYGSEKQ